MIKEIAVWLVSRISVRDRFIPRAADLIKSYLKGKGCRDVDLISNKTYVSLAYEAFRRAALKEEDGNARWGRFINEINQISETLLCFLHRQALDDSRVKQILEMHEVNRRGQP